MHVPPYFEESPEVPAEEILVLYIAKETSAPDIGWWSLDYLTKADAEERCHAELEAGWLKLKSPIKILSTEQLWWSPNGSVWVTDKKDFMNDPNCRCVLPGKGSDPYTERERLHYRLWDMIKDVVKQDEEPFDFDFDENLPEIDFENEPFDDAPYTKEEDSKES